MTQVTSTGTSPEVFDIWLSSNHWTPTTLTFSFPTDDSFYGYTTPVLYELSTSQKDAVRRALDDIASFTGLTFVEVTETLTTEGTLRFINETGLGGAAAYTPNSGETGGDAVFGSGTTNPVIGNEAYLFFIHEIGHAMGLLHGHEYPSFVATGLDSQEYTVVTYTDYVGDTDTFQYDSGPIDWAQSFQQLDIAALQFLYGANYSSTGEVWSGDTVYMFDPTTGEMSINGTGQGTPAGNRIFRTIWDGDGVDTYDLSNYTTDLSIDLAPGAFSTFSQAQLADLNRHSTDPAFLAAGNVANARLVLGDTRALIENAKGGSGRDTIKGNIADNRLEGGGNADFLYGYQGDDVLLGGVGHDRLFGAQGKDLLQGGDGRDKLYGGSQNDRVYGQNGNDKGFGGGGNDKMWGGAHNDVLFGQDGADTLYGGGGQDKLWGGARNDVLLGQSGRDKLYGGGGSDVIEGGGHADEMTGHSGRDRFVFASAGDSNTISGVDVILDFVSGQDWIDLRDMIAGTFTLDIGGSFDGLSPKVITALSGIDTVVQADVDGDGTAEFELLLKDITTVTSGDFLL